MLEGGGVKALVDASVDAQNTGLFYKRKGRGGGHYGLTNSEVSRLISSNKGLNISFKK